MEKFVAAGMEVPGAVRVGEWQRCRADRKFEVDLKMQYEKKNEGCPAELHISRRKSGRMGTDYIIDYGTHLYKTHYPQYLLTQL